MPVLSPHQGAWRGQNSEWVAGSRERAGSPLPRPATSNAQPGGPREWRKGEVGLRGHQRGGDISEGVGGAGGKAKPKMSVAPPWGPCLVFEEIKLPTRRSRFLLTSTATITVDRGAWLPNSLKLRRRKKGLATVFPAPLLRGREMALPEAPATEVSFSDDTNRSKQEKPKKRIFAEMHVSRIPVLLPD